MLLAGQAPLAASTGAVTVSAVPMQESGEVGGLQNTSSTSARHWHRLAGSIPIASLTASFLAGIEETQRVDAVVSAATGVVAGFRSSQTRIRMALADAVRRHGGRGRRECGKHD
jgi:hypothetical protein